MVKFRASVVYTPEKIQELEKVIASTFYQTPTIIRYLICVVLIAYGLSKRTPGGFVLMAFAALIIGTGNMTGKYRANKTIEALNGKDLKMDYQFYDINFQTDSLGQKAVHQYQDMMRLVEDTDCFYIFENASTSFRIDKGTISPGSEEAFKTFVAEKVGLEWTARVKLISTNLRTIRFNKKNTRTNKQKEGKS
jgi:hypothetical protein